MAARDLFQNDLTNLNFDSYLSETEPFKSYDMDHTDLRRLKDGHVGGQVRQAAFVCLLYVHEILINFLHFCSVRKRKDINVARNTLK